MAAPDLDVESANVRGFEVEGRKINGKTMDMFRIDEIVEVNATEIWEVANTDGSYHNFHVHDVQFEVLAGLGLLMIGAMITHVRRNESRVIVLGLAYPALAGFVVWGRFGSESFIG